MNRPITSEILVAYSQCPRNAFLLLCTEEKGTPHEYVRILQRQRIANQSKYINDLKQKKSDVQRYDINNLQRGSDFLFNATLKAEGLEADCDVLTKVEESSSLGEYSYEPTIVVGTHSIAKQQRLELFFVGYVLGQIQDNAPPAGRIIVMGQKSREVKLENCTKTLIPLLEPLREWTPAWSPEPPPLILSKHCPYCQFQSLCKAKAEQEDNLSLLDRVTPKVIQRYKKKGIFTVKQLSYLYKPRRRKKRAKNPPRATHKPELQALAIRTGRIYLEELPELFRQPIELFLDIEGISDQQVHYLIGLLVCEADMCTHHSFWADTPQDEAQIWQQFLEKVNQYPDAPIYHYGSYEPRAINKLGRRYETDSESLRNRLVNLNTYIYGKVYFPVRSNRLKEIGNFIGATWTSPNASGLESLVWRYHWDETRDAQYQDLLVTYNAEDCQALKLLTDELSRIEHSADTLAEVDFADQPKRQATETGKEIHSQFEAILRFARSDYDRKKISFRQNGIAGSNETRKQTRPKVRGSYQKKVRKPTRIVRVPQRSECPKCENQPLKETKRTTENIVVDLAFAEHGIQKTLTKYWAAKGFCRKCGRYYNPPDFNVHGRPPLYGRGFKVWITYQRVAFRLSYQNIRQMIEDLFDEGLSDKLLLDYLRDSAGYYSETERILIHRILESPFLHVDETKINIQGSNQYVWVFTDGKRVVFKLTETREATIVHEFLANYNGVLISDFYAGYDSVKCRQQKCWVHLIRDLNNDLWKAPLDPEFEVFVSEVKNLIVPILATVEEYGLKARHLSNYKRQVNRFYEKVITGQTYKSDLTIKYQKRFIRYREGLFTFLEQDGIPWHNNTAESAIRHIALQRKTSGAFHESMTHDYLLLLGIRQSCRFQDKSFLEFLLSGEKDIDQFKEPEPIRSS